MLINFGGVRDVDATYLAHIRIITNRRFVGGGQVSVATSGFENISIYGLLGATFKAIRGHCPNDYGTSIWIYSKHAPARVDELRSAMKPYERMRK